MNIIINIFLFIILLFLITSGGLFIHYGNKIKNNDISSKDKEAGQYIISSGAIGLFINIIGSIMIGYKFNNPESSKSLLMIYIFTILFTAACNVVLIIYGLKIYQNNICIDTPNCQRSNCIDDYKIAEFIIIIGIICIIFGSLSILFFFYITFISKKKIDTQYSATSEMYPLNQP